MSNISPGACRGAMRVTRETSIMASDERNQTQVIWGILLIGMGVLLCVTTPYALKMSPDSAFLNFSRYFIAFFLIVAGAKKLYGFYVTKDKEPHSGE